MPGAAGLPRAPRRIAILISGGGSNMLRLIESMTGDHPARPVLVLASDPAAPGLARAAAAGVPTAAVDHRRFRGDRAGFEAALTDALLPAAPDLLCLAGFMRVLTPAFVARWPMVNIHPSLLPLYPGLHTHARALAAGDAEAGASVHAVTAELDAGPLLGQIRVPVLPDDSAEALAARVLAAEHRLYPAVLRRLAEGGSLPLHL